jgi:hypothetical protein
MIQPILSINYHPHNEYVVNVLFDEDLKSIFQPQSIVETLKPADVHKMLVKQDTPVNLILEQINLGRGKFWFVEFID